MYWQGEAIKWRTTAYYWGLELNIRRKANDDLLSIGKTSISIIECLVDENASLQESNDSRQDAIQALSDSHTRLFRENIKITDNLYMYMDEYYKGYGLGDGGWKTAFCDFGPFPCDLGEELYADYGPFMEDNIITHDPRDACRQGAKFNPAYFVCTTV